MPSPHTQRNQKTQDATQLLLVQSYRDYMELEIVATLGFSAQRNELLYFTTLDDGRESDFQ